MDSSEVLTYLSTQRVCSLTTLLSNGAPQPASVAIGFSEDEWIALQLDGTIRMLSEESEITDAKKIHYAKIPSSQEYESDASNAFLAFTPTWWRYTDFNTEPPVVIQLE